jgi:hypothetical protein
VVHFACLSDAEGLVLRWGTEIVAVAEPSVEAEAFASGAAESEFEFDSGGPPNPPRRSHKRSLRELCASRTRLEVRGILHELLGEHVQRIPASAGAPSSGAGGSASDVGAYVFRKYAPFERLDASACAAALGVWREKIIVSVAPMDARIIETILDAEAKVVVAPDEAAARFESRAPDSDAVVAGFFSAFYHALYVVGADAVAALGAAALVQPKCARFRCHMRIDGKLVVLKAGDDDLLPEE